ncbi:MAG TPA: thioredoxin domain-containing protein [Candidatus Polarisedimenticolia bacterium]|nr:thioredoxin domain-containing protein [Candidatus Polarisedimenticolia bacterium]
MRAAFSAALALALLVTPAADRKLEELPGAPPLPGPVAAKILAALRVQGPSYRPETLHRNGDGSPRYTNRLILESSPYLRQHAHNPVDWHPWGEEAFEQARLSGKPVLLSVGYSTCHWCHVMERESFEDEEIARYLNENFIAIKVDREERPDIDSLYMSAVSALTGRGGWPMTVWLTPAKQPFYGGTYFPARDGDRGAPVGFLTMLRKIREAYRRPGSSLEDSARKLTDSLRAAFASPPAGDLPEAGTLRKAVEAYRRSFDPEFGGLLGATKFPSTLPVRLLLRYHRRFGDAEALKMASLTLERMAAGGIYDQIGGGFHRYSTDRRWRVPHFEKMLYDNALLVLAYLDGAQAIGRADFAQIARETLTYLRRDMRSPEGAFYAATDADSADPRGHAEEGRFFTWTPEEIRAVLGAQRSRLVLDVFGVSPGGNFSSGRSVLVVDESMEEAAKRHSMPVSETRASVESARRELYQARLRRPAPHRDEKVVTAWNGLAISALARAALVLQDPAYARDAERTADFLFDRAFQGGRLRRSVTASEARQEAFLSDYAFLTAGLLDLYEATWEPRRLRQALELDSILEKHFEDAEHGGFYLTSDDAQSLPVREKPAEDGSEPSGNSVAVMNLLRFHELTGQERFLERGKRALKAFGTILAGNPAALSEMLLAVDFHDDTPKEIVIVTPRRAQEAAPFLSKLRNTYLPNRILVVASEGSDVQSQAERVPLLKGKTTRGGRTTAYLCEDRVCLLPTTSPEEFEKQLRRVPRVRPAAKGQQGAAAP